MVSATAPTSKAPAAKHKFTVDYSRPANDGVFDGAAYEKFLHDRIKVDNKAGQLGDKVKITRDDQNHRITVTANIPFSKRYLNKDVYQLRFYNLEGPDDEEE
ncbi:ribosomal L22e protein family-domain-containing protein [Russula brevipes]|nr:ribosomal L22e protein family-domain-containing protein [Russula brevipes]